jgi:hypothetical protein
MRDLGNEDILTGKGGITIRNPEAANELLGLAMDLAKEKRRLIYFCSCETPCSCHRNTVRNLLLQYARKHEQPVQVVEWPGGDAQMVDVAVSGTEFGKLRRGKKSIPLSDSTLSAKFAGFPWGSVAKVHPVISDDILYVITGPARCNEDKEWYLPVLKATTQGATEQDGLRFREKYGYVPLG